MSIPSFSRPAFTPHARATQASHQRLGTDLESFRLRTQQLLKSNIITVNNYFAHIENEVIDPIAEHCDQKRLNTFVLRIEELIKEMEAQLGSLNGTLNNSEEFELDLPLQIEKLKNKFERIKAEFHISPSN